MTRYPWQPRPGELRVRERYEARIVRFEIGDNDDLLPVEVGRGITNIRPMRADVEYRAGALHRIHVEGQVIRKSDGLPGGRGRQAWHWPHWDGDKTWPPTDRHIPLLVVQLVRIADGDWDEVPSAADGTILGRLPEAAR